MPKKSKDVQTESANGSRPRVKKAPAKKALSKIVRARNKTPARPRLEEKTLPPTDEQIRLRAYFIAQQRAQKSIEGDPQQRLAGSEAAAVRRSRSALALTGVR